MEAKGNLTFSIKWLAGLTFAFGITFSGLSANVFLGFVAALFSFGVFGTCLSFNWGLIRSELGAYGYIVLSEFMAGSAYLTLGWIVNSWSVDDHSLLLFACLFGLVPCILVTCPFVFITAGIIVGIQRFPPGASKS